MTEETQEVQGPPEPPKTQVPADLLWRHFQQTPPEYTKNFKGAGGFSGTAINACYVAMRLTQTFGPCGAGWGFWIEEEKIFNGHKLNEEQNQLIHRVKLRLWYQNKDQWIEQYGHTTFVGANRHGLFTDDEFSKKSVTDALSKCASYLGVGADVHLGLYDDSKYVADLRSAENAKKAEAMSQAIDPLAKLGAILSKEYPGNTTEARDKRADMFNSFMKECGYPPVKTATDATPEQIEAVLQKLSQWEKIKDV